MDSAALKTFQQCLLVLVGRCAFGLLFCTENTCVPPELCQEIGRCWVRCCCGRLVDALQNWTINSKLLHLPWLLVFLVGFFFREKGWLLVPLHLWSALVPYESNAVWKGFCASAVSGCAAKFVPLTDSFGYAGTRGMFVSWTGWIRDPGDSPERRTLHVPANLWCLPKLTPFPSQPYQLPPVSCAVKFQLRTSR